MEIINNNIKFNLIDNKINGILCNNKDNIIKILKINDNKILSTKDVYNYKNNIIVVDNILNNNYKNINELFLKIIDEYRLYPKDINKKIKDALKIVGLKEEILNLGINDISSSERKILELSIALLLNRDIIVLVEPFDKLDLNNRKRIKIILEKLVEKYNKKVVIISNDIEVLFRYTNNLIIIKNNKLVIEGDTFKVLTNVDLLKKHHIDIPEIIEVAYLAKKNKNIKIDYYKDVRDIIKDIYKHV